MPTNLTITASDFVDFTTKVQPNNTISSSEVTGNWAIWRGHLLPVDPTTSAAGATNNWDIGSSTYVWKNIHCQSITVSNGIKTLFSAYTTTANTSYSCTALDGFINYTDTATGTITLMTATAGREVAVRKYADTLTVLTIDAVGSATIDNTLTTTLNTYGETVLLIGDGSNNWRTKARVIPGIRRTFTPTGTWTANITYSGAWTRLNGSMALIEIETEISGALSATGQVIDISGTLTIDGNKLFKATVDSVGNLGVIGEIRDGAVNSFGLGVQLTSGNSLQLLAPRASGTYLDFVGLSNTIPITYANTDSIRFRTILPITGWKEEI